MLPSSSRLGAEMNWDVRGLWYWIPAALFAASFFVDQPLHSGLKTVALVVAFGVTALLRRSDSTWSRSKSDDGPVDGHKK